MVSVDIIRGLSGHCPWTEWTMSMDSVDIIHGLSGHCPWTKWTLSTSVDIVHVLVLQPDSVHGQCSLSPWTFYRWKPPMECQILNMFCDMDQWANLPFSSLTYHNDPKFLDRYA